MSAVWFKISLIAFLALCDQCRASGAAANSGIPEQLQKDLDKATEACKKEISNITDIFDKEPQNAQDKKNLACSVACVLNQLGYMKGPKLDDAKILQIIPTIPDAGQIPVDILKSCMAKASTIPDKCDTIISVLDCLDAEVSKKKS